MTNPQPGDFGLVKIPGPVGTLISLGEAANGEGFTEFDHAFIYVGDQPDGTNIVEAEPGGARLGRYQEYASVTWSSWDLTGAQRAAIVGAALGYLGTPYSVVDYLALSAHRLRLPLPFLKSHVANNRAMICSQLVDRCYADAGVHLFDDSRWEGFVTPASLSKALSGPVR